MGPSGSEWLHWGVGAAYVSRFRRMGLTNDFADPDMRTAIAECAEISSSSRLCGYLPDHALSLPDIITLSIENDKRPEAFRFNTARIARNRDRRNDFVRGAYPQFPAPTDKKRARRQPTV